MNVKTMTIAAVLAAMVACAVVSAGPADKSAQPPTTLPASDQAVVIPALAPPGAASRPAAAPAVAPRLQPAPDGVAASQEAQRLRKLLAGPPDDAALTELAALRNRRLQRDADALDALARGLRLYLEVSPRLAAGPLEKATGNPNVYALASSLPRSLDEIAAQCRAASGNPAARACPRCGDTRWAPCAKCGGSGYVPCPKCSGTGMLRGSDGAVPSLCDQCGGAGVVVCRQGCGGTGVVECPACKTKPAQAEEIVLPAAEVQEIRKVICKARWVRAGGIDLYTNGARAPSPK